MDETHVCWTDSVDDSVQRVPKTGGAIEQLGAWQHNTTAIYVASAGVFWANRGSFDDGQIMRWSASEGVVEEVTALDQPMQITVDNTRIWWLSDGDDALYARDIAGGPVHHWGFLDTPRSLAGRVATVARSPARRRRPSGRR